MINIVNIHYRFDQVVPLWKRISMKTYKVLKSSAWSVRIPVIQKEGRTHHMSNRESPDMAPTKEKFGQITCHFECASADNFLTNLIVGQIM